MRNLLLNVLAFATIFSAVLVITSKNPAKRFGKMLLWVKLSNSGNTLKLFGTKL
jgi:NADH:ubiquinone oxidoreductase subunit 6 (subunit J)